MQGREFLELAKELVVGNGPCHWRGAIIHAYYALLLECREAMNRWGLPAPTRHQIHSTIRLRLVFASHAELKNIGRDLEKLAEDRNRANYDLRPVSMFATNLIASIDLKKADDALALLDAIDADPVRRAAAIASIRP